MGKYLLSSIFIASLFFGCKQKDITPSWLKINEFSLATNEALQGSNSHNIANVWLYMDNEPLGVFELPCKIPVLDEGEHTFRLFPGIINNGISNTRVRYPFYNEYEVNGTLVKNDTLELNPATTYKSATNFAFIEDFEDAGISFVKGPSSDTDFVFISTESHPDIVKYGDKCGGVFLNQTDSIFTVITESFMNLPKGGEDVYLEIDYRNDNILGMGVLARYADGSSSQHTPLIYMNAQDPGEEVWKKIYIDLKEDVSFEIVAESFEIYFLSVIDTDDNTGEIYIDNVKVVHFE